MDADFDRKWEHYDSVKTDLGLTAVWSIYEVENLSERHPFENVNSVTYVEHWGESGPVTSAINGSTWAALYVAANACIRDSGDAHHIYIERFKPEGNTLVLTTGS